MPVIDDFLFEETYTSDDWLEDIGESRNDSIAHDGAIFTLPVYCTFAKYKACRNFIMGYAYVDDNNKLRRKNPIWHPIDGWAYAHKISSVTFSKATGKTDGPWEGGVPFAVYTWARLMVEFQHVPYRIVEDDYFGVEYKRYLVQIPDTYNEIVEINAGFMKYHCPSVTGLNGTVLQSNRAYRYLEKGRVALKWYRVPVEFIQNTDGQRPKFSAMEKRVNTTSFLGRGKQTLLCESIKATDPYPAPIATDVRDEPAMMVDVTFNLIEFNPTRGDSTVDKWGWQLQPGSRRLTGAVGDTVIGWYYVTHDGTLTGKPMFEEYEFANAFTHWSV